MFKLKQSVVKELDDVVDNSMTLIPELVGCIKQNYHDEGMINALYNVLPSKFVSKEIKHIILVALENFSITGDEYFLSYIIGGQENACRFRREFFKNNDITDWCSLKDRCAAAVTRSAHLYSE